MLNIIIGHRGTGKSHWLRLLKAFYKARSLQALFFDLDREVKKAEGKSLLELFKEGEASFRKTEKKIFQKLIKSVPKNKTVFISVGAGFVFKKKSSWNIIYLCRYSDKTGRMFLNRPRLTSLSPFQEYQNLYKKRHLYYLKQTDEQLFRREHFKHLETSDFLFLGLKKLSKPCFTLRLNSQDVPKSQKQFKLFLQKRLNWGLRFFELNDQTADKNLIQTVKKLVPEKKLLFSSQCSKKFTSIKNKQHWSWDLSLGVPPKGVNILTLHERNRQGLKAILKKMSSYKNCHLKLAVEIFNLKEIKTAYEWYCQDPKHRSFLPRSKEGRWLWFRQAFGSKMFLHFIKEREGILDQPFLSEAVPFIKKRKALAGILADPVRLSATPAEQSPFFSDKHSIPVLPVPLKEEEMTKENLKIFSELGFVFFAVSSPLKNQAFLSADVCDKISQEFQTANTLIFHNKKWMAFNTDWHGLKKIKPYSAKDTVVWGGGGIRAVLKKCLPLAQFYSARSGKPLIFDSRTKLLDAKGTVQTKRHPKSFSPKTVIWAVGRNRIQQGCLMPPKFWRPLRVIDINYTEDSPGLEYALQVQAQYKNGMNFFKEQAKKQREIFKKLKKC